MQRLPAQQRPPRTALEVLQRGMVSCQPADPSPAPPHRCPAEEGLLRAPPPHLSTELPPGPSEALGGGLCSPPEWAGAPPPRWAVDPMEDLLMDDAEAGLSRRAQRRHKQALWRQKETVPPREGMRKPPGGGKAPRGKPRSRSEAEGDMPSPRNDARRRRRRVDPEPLTLLVEPEQALQSAAPPTPVVIENDEEPEHRQQQQQQRGGGAVAVAMEEEDHGTARRDPMHAEPVKVEELLEGDCTAGGDIKTSPTRGFLQVIPVELIKNSLAFLPPSSLASFSKSSKSGAPQLADEVARSLCLALRAGVSSVASGDWITCLELLHAAREATHAGVAEAIIEMVNGKMVLGRLRVVGGNVTDEELQPLCRAIAALPPTCPLQLVNLSGNCIRDPGALALARALQYHTKSLHAICLARNQIGSAGAQALAHLAEHCTRLGVFYLAANPLHRVHGVDYAPASESPPETSPRLPPSPTCVAISEELLMRADARLLASMARHWSASRRYSELLPLAKEYAPSPTTAGIHQIEEECQLPPTHLASLYEEHDKQARQATELDGVEALVQAVQVNRSLTTLSIRATGIAPCFCDKIREAWGDRSATGLYL